jgi:hypothetical protein
MKKKKKTTKEKASDKNFWTSTSVILGIVSAALGIILAVFNISTARNQQTQFGVTKERTN